MKRRNFIGYSLIFIGGCTAATSHRSDLYPRAINVPTKLRLAVTDAIGSEKLERDYGKFRSVLEQVLGIKVEFFPVVNMPAAASALQSDRVDLVLTGPSEYVVIRSRTNASPIIAITRPNYRSAIAVPAASGITSVAQLKGKTIALSDIGSTSGHLGPTKMLMEARLDPKNDLKVLMLGDEGSVEALKKGEVDAWGGSAVDYEQFFQEEGLSKMQFPAIAFGPLLPSDVFVTSSHLDPSLVNEIRDRLVENQDKLIEALAIGEATQKYKGSKLVPANDADYDPIREVYKVIGQGNFLK